VAAPGKKLAEKLIFLVKARKKINFLPSSYFVLFEPNGGELNIFDWDNFFQGRSL